MGLGSSYDQPMSRAAVENLERWVSRFGWWVGHPGIVDDDNSGYNGG